MAIAADEYRSIVGVENLVYALVTKDDSTGYTAGTVKSLAPAAEVSLEPKSDSKTQYADNKPYDAMVSEGETTVKIVVTGIPSETYAEILGKNWDSTTGRVYDNLGTPPYVAVGWKALKSNGKYKYIWFMKGRFAPPSEEAATKTDSPDPKTQEMTFTAVKTIATFTLAGSVTDGVKLVRGDDDTASFSGTTWFTQVQTPSVASPSALALSSIVPAADAPSVVVSADVVLTFNNALQTGEEADILLATAAGVQVACATTIDAARKVVTLNPNSNMAAGTVHIVSYAVKDVYNQTLAGVSKFTTA